MTVGTRLWIRLGFSLFLFGGTVLGFVAAQAADDTKKKNTPVPDLKLPAVFSKPVPENVQELREIEEHVQKVVEKVMPAVVGIRVGPGQGSGVIISEDGLILTAGHVSGTPKQTAYIRLFQSKAEIKGKTLGQNTGIDSGMVKITGEGKYPFLEMGKSSELKKGQWVMAIGHPGGFRPNRPPVVRLGRILQVTNFLIQTDCSLVGGDSGGPLFDMQGRVIGIHSRIGGSQITENVHVPIDTFRHDFAKLEKGDSWGGQLGQVETVRSAGGKLVFEKKDKFTKDDPTMPAPNPMPMESDKKTSYFKVFTFRMKAGSTYTLDLFSNEKIRKNGANLDPFLRLETPEGKKIAEDDDSAGSPNARIVYKAIKDGDYRMIASTFDGEQTGSFTLKIYEADYRDALVSGTTDVLRAIKLPLPAVTPLVEKFKLAKMPLHINAILLDEKGNPAANKEVTLNWEKGAEKLKSDNQGVVRWLLVQDKARKLNLELPKDTRAMLALTDKDGTSIGLTFGKDNPDPSLEKVKSRRRRDRQHL